MPEVNDEVKIIDGVNVKNVQNAAPPGSVKYAKVKVLAESGIFKDGKHYDFGDEAVITLASAQGFEAIGEVEIIKEVDEAEL